MSNFRNLLNSSLGLEDDAPNVQVNIDTDEAGMPIDNMSDEGEMTPEADEVEINEDASEIEADNEVIDEMAEATEALESMYLAMESSQADGGLTPEAARFAALGIEAIVGKYGATAKDVGVSLEAFNDNRSVATTVSMEGIVETLKSLWETIVKKFHEMIKKIVDFFQKTIAAAPRIKRRAEAIRKKARSTNGSPKDKEISTGLFRSLNIQGKAPSAAELIDSLKRSNYTFSKNAKQKDIEKAAKAIFKTANMQDANGLDLANIIIKGIDPSLTVASQGSGYIVSGTGGGTAPHPSFKISGKGNDKAVLTQGKLLGNKCIWIGHAGSQVRENALDALRDFRSGVFNDNQGYKADSTKERETKFKVLSTSDVEAICDIVIQTMDEIINQKTQTNKKLNDVKVMKATGDKFISDMKGDDGEKKNSMASKVLNNTVDALRQDQAGEAQFLRYNYSTAKAALAYCARSLSNYK